MATIANEAIKAVTQLTGESPATIACAEGASQTFVGGELVFRNGGYLEEIGGDTPALIYGVAAGDAHNSTAGAYDVPVYLAHDLQLFAGNVKETGLANHVLVAADIGVVMAIQRDTTNSMTFLNASTKAGTGVRVFVHKLARGSAIGDTNARVLFSFLGNWSQGASTS